MSEEKCCRGCGSPLAQPFLDLGKTPLANAFLRQEQLSIPEETLPLAVAYCNVCHLVQLTDLAQPEKLFSEYLYFSSYSESFLAHAREMAEGLTKRFGLGVQSRVLEVASNDGYLLQYFQQRHIPVLGVEAAKNIVAEAERRGVPTLNRFFGPSTAEEIKDRFGCVDLLIGNNVLAHVPTINAFLRAAKECLKPTGVAVFEFPYLNELLERTEFDTIYHEHVFYFSLSSVMRLLERAGLNLFDVEQYPIHGGSLRVFVGHQDAHAILPRVLLLLEQETRLGLTSAACYTSFSQRVTDLKNELLNVLWRLKNSGKRLAAYGAPAKGNTLLNHCGIGRQLLEFTVDRNPHKQGLFLPGTHIPIKSPAKIEQSRPDYLLVLPWNLRDEIMQQMANIRVWGGKFIIPIPQVQVCT